MKGGNQKMKKILTIAVLLLAVIGLSVMVYAGVGPGTYNTTHNGEQEVQISIHTDPTMGVTTVTYTHKGVSKSVNDGEQDLNQPGTVTDAGSVTFSDGIRYKIANSEVLWSNKDGGRWGKLIRYCGNLPCDELFSVATSSI